MKKTILLIIFYLLLIPSLVSQGLIRDSKSSELIKKNPRVKIGKTRSLNTPTSFSLEKFTPHVFNQGRSDMCTAYSLALARTIVYARNNNLTNKNQISAESYSPYYIYTKYKSVINEDFEGGLNMYFNKLNEYGYAKMKIIEYPHYYPFTENQLWDFSVPSYTNLDLKFIKSEKFDIINSIDIDNYETEEDRSELVVLIKSELLRGRPILFGINLYETFYGSEDVWYDNTETYCSEMINTNQGEDRCGVVNANPSGMCDRHKPENYYAGHAMTVIAYDDQKYEGAFLIQNSWGLHSHNEGKVWIPYDVFARLAEDIQSVDKSPKSIFDDKYKYSINYPSKELNFKTKNFSKFIDPNWFLFAALNIEELDIKKLKKGKMILPNNLTLKGTLKENLLNGYGELNLNDKFIYKGNFNAGYFDGQGELSLYDNWGDLTSQRVGVFSLGKFSEGDAQEIVKDRRLSGMYGYSFKGKIKNGKYSGYGELTHNQYDYNFKGNFDNNWPSNGKEITGWYRYEGEFKFFYPHGYGKRIILRDGTVEEGVFDYGKFID